MGNKGRVKKLVDERDDVVFNGDLSVCCRFDNNATVIV